MKRSEANKIIKENSPKWLLEAMDDLIEMSIEDEWETQYDYYDCVDEFDDTWRSDYDSKSKRAFNKIYKALGIYVQVKEGEDHRVYSSHTGREKILKVGSWYCAKSYSQLITQED